VVFKVKKCYNGFAHRFEVRVSNIREVLIDRSIDMLVLQQRARFLSSLSLKSNSSMMIFARVEHIPLSLSLPFILSTFPRPTSSGLLLSPNRLNSCSVSSSNRNTTRRPRERRLKNTAVPSSLERVDRLLSAGFPRTSIRSCAFACLRRSNPREDRNRRTIFC
jgi:hypothetical protein